MRIGVWEDGHLHKCAIGDLNTNYNRSTWIDVVDPTAKTEDMTEISVETVRDLISMHLDTVSNDMNKTMRLLAAITVMVAIPSVIGSSFGMNLIDQPWPLRLWEVALVGASTIIMFAIYFYRKGWFGDL